MWRLQVRACLAALFGAFLVSQVESFPHGRVVVLGTEFFWMNTDSNSLQPLRFAGYSDYDLATAQRITRDTGCRNDPVPNDESFVVPRELLDEVLERLSPVNGENRPNLLRLWVSGKHNARDWDNGSFTAQQCIDEHDYMAFGLKGSGRYDLLDDFEPNVYVPRLEKILTEANNRNLVVLLTIFDNITLRRDADDGYNYSTSPWNPGNHLVGNGTAELPMTGFAYPQWYFTTDRDTQTITSFPNLWCAQATYIQKVLQVAQGHGNVIVEIMNEPGTGEHNSQHQIAFWHEIMGLVIHTLDPTRVVISDQAFTADTNGIFRVTTVGCPTPHQPGCEDVGDSASATANALLDMPDVDAYALHFGQWAFDPKVDDSYDNAMALDEMNAVFSRGTDHLFKTNIRPIIADTDAATLDDTGVSCPTNNLPMEETCRAPDRRISERNVGHLDTWVQRALDLGASFNHKDGIGTTDRTSGDKCLIADSRQVLSSIPSEIDQRIDTQALGILASQTHGLGRLTEASFRHPPDWVGIDIRYSGDFASCGQGQCLDRYSTTDPNVSFLVTLRNNTTATRSVRLQYRWLTYQRNTDQIFGDAFASGYSEPIDLPPGPFYWLEEPAAVPVPSELVGQLALVLKVEVVNASNTSEVYDTNQLVALNESTLPQFPINECQLPGSLYRAFIPDQPTFPPVIDPGSLEATVYGTSAVLAWAVSDADSPTSVSIALDTVNPPEAVIVSDLESDNFVVDDLAPGTTYYWKVSAFDTGQNATFGAVTSFQVTGPYQNGVVLTRPADGTANVPPTTILEWNVVDPEPDLRFSVYFDACPGGSCPNPPTTLICSNISGTTCNPPPSDLGVPPCIPAQLEDNTQYIWRVVAHGSTPTESMGVFTTGVRQVEHEFQLFSPVNNTVPWEDVRVIWREDSQCFNWDTTRIVYRNEANIGQFWTVLDHPQTSGCFPPPPGESVQFYCEDLPDLEPDAAYQWGVFVPDCTKGGRLLQSQHINVHGNME